MNARALAVALAVSLAVGVRIAGAGGRDPSEHVSLRSEQFQEWARQQPAVLVPSAQ